MKVVAFNGSPRANGNTSILLKYVLQELEKEGIETELIQIGGKQIRGCVACYKCSQNQNGRCIYDDDIVNESIAKIVEADGVILGSPVYFADLTAPMKAFIERVGLVGKGNNSMFKRKIGASVVAVRRAGSIQAFNTMNNFFTIEQMIIVGSSYWNMALGRNIGEVENDEEGVQTMRVLGQNMAWLLKKVHS